MPASIRSSPEVGRVVAYQPWLNGEHPPFSVVIPGRAKREPGNLEIPGSMLSHRPGMTGMEHPALLYYSALTVWIPHSVFGRPRQRPARASSSAEVREVQGMQPTER
jgi:hypothetical protein